MPPPISTLSQKQRAQTPTVTARVTRQRATKDAITNTILATPRRPNSIAMGNDDTRKVTGKATVKEKNPSPAHTENLKAYLRIRPPPISSDQSSRPYLEIQSDTDVIMRPPHENARHHIPKPPHIFSFDRVFPPSTPQSPFFITTTLPLVEKLLQGENGLLFAYGVSNSGKSYTIQGGSNVAETERGVLPRALDVVFNSIEGLHCPSNLKPHGLADVEFSAQADEPLDFVDNFATAEPRISDTVKVDRNFSYAVFVSYVEVYNEKIFDLLDSALPAATPTRTRPRTTYNKFPRTSSMQGTSLPFNASMNLAAMANGGGGVLRRQALSLKNNPEGSGKYVAGLRDVRVRTREEALAVFRSGQSARQVFGTLANRESSRSHGIFTIKLVRIHNGAPSDPDSTLVSRLAIVDLAGSERNRNTQTTGDRLKEAGNINKSLMVLGQCLEVLRSNQQRMMTPAINGVKKKIAVVPFRHSKLTEIFQNFFVGDGRAVIIINVNPYDTGFDENSHVMRFSASAREVQTNASSRAGIPLLKRQISTQFNAFRHAVSQPMKIKVTVPLLREEESKKTRGGKKYMANRESEGFVMVEEELEIEEEDAQSEDEEGKDLLVEYLFEQLKEMKTRLYEAEMRATAVEVEVRNEMVEEMQEVMQKMQEDFTCRLQEQIEASELKADRKIDIVMHSMIPTISHAAHDQFTPSGINANTPADTTISDDKSFDTAIDESLICFDKSTPTVQSDPFVTQTFGSPSTIPSLTISRASASDGFSVTEDNVREKCATVLEEKTPSRGEVPQCKDILVVHEKTDMDETEDNDDYDNEEDEDEDEYERSETESEGSVSIISHNVSSDEQSIVEHPASFSPDAARKDVVPANIIPAKTRNDALSSPQIRQSLKAVSRSKKETNLETPPPLRERIAQLQIEDEDDKVPIRTTVKKKRTLAKKKVVTEDEMDMHDMRISGVEVTRLKRSPK
ncbi:uncharacterized protein L203_100815 [Cryptococcus depauperatus CBS 7841]|uniref:Kinesin-like protein n=1 Tax=Cryptococcus depauperatus CBS 7841 TaxID=1295531 RepID=A0A1E3IXL0_9TREE|nr:kinesin family member 20/23 [Cryptococcus depauperatus CBS 7841]